MSQHSQKNDQQLISIVVEAGELSSQELLDFQLEVVSADENGI